MPEIVNLLKDTPWRLMRKLSLPGILGMMVLSVNSLIDATYLGNMVSADAFAGVSLLFPITLIVSSVTGFIAAGSTSVLSRAIGAKNRAVQQKVMPNLLMLSLISSAVLMLLGWLFSEQTVALLGAEHTVLKAGTDYLHVYLIGVFFSIFGLASNALIRAEGKVKQAMQFTVIAVIVNVILTPVFIRLLHLGVQGAAWSSMASMIVYSIFTSLYFIRNKASFKVGKLRVRLEKEIIGDVISVGFSAFSMQISNVLRQFIVFRSVTWYGTGHDLAVFSAGFRLFAFISVPAMGLLQPLQPIIGVNYGAGNRQRCVQTIRFFRNAGIIFLAIMSLMLVLFTEWFISIMIPGLLLAEQEVFLLRSIFIVLPFLPFSTITIIYLQAIGMGRKASLLPLLRQGILFLPLILILPYLFQVSGIYFTLALENVVYAILLWLVMSKEFQCLRHDAQP